MKWLLRIVLGLVAIIGLLGLIGYSLPVAHESSRSAEFNKPPDAVFALLADVPNYQTWWDGADVKSEVVERVPPTRIVSKIVGETQFGGTWTMEISPTPNGSRLTIIERGEIYNPIFRALAKYVFGYTGTMESCLAAAQKRLA